MPSDMDAADSGDEHYSCVSPISIERLGRVRLLQLRGAALLHIMAGAYVRPLFVKTHWQRCNFENVEIFPPCVSERAVYIVRDPRDVAVSFSKWLGHSYDQTIETLGSDKAKLNGVNVEALITYLGSWSAHVASWAGRKDTLVIRYEDMLETPAEIFAGVLAHVGISINEERIHRAVAAVSFDKLQAAENAGRFIETPDTAERFFRKGTAGQWRDELTPEQAAQIEATHSEWMGKMGYLDGPAVRVA